MNSITWRLTRLVTAVHIVEKGGSDVHLIKSLMKPSDLKESRKFLMALCRADVSEKRKNEILLNPSAGD